jgi:hypothetical protein
MLKPEWKISGDNNGRVAKVEDSLGELVENEQSEALARQLLEEFGDEVKSARFKDIEGLGTPEKRFFMDSDYQDGIGHFLSGVPKEILKHQIGHGITRGDDSKKLTAALNILANSSVRGDFGELAGSSYINAYTDADFLALTDYGRDFRNIFVQGPNGEKRVMHGDSALFHLQALVVNTKFYPLVDKLKELFPNRIILRANELPEYFERIGKVSADDQDSLNSDAGVSDGEQLEQVRQELNGMS